MRITYFINQYPKVSHSFIRREILALERQGFEVQRIALRGWDGELVDAEDLREREQTQYVLKIGGLSLLSAIFQCALASPSRFISALFLTLRMGRHADRPWSYHLIYLAEACRIVPWMHTFNSSHVHAHFGTNSAEVAMLAHALGGPPYSFTVHGPEEFDKPQFIGLGEKIRRSAFLVAISSYGRSQLFRWVGHDHWSKVQVVHCGLERAFHEVTPVPIPETPRLVCVGQLCEQKGQLLLIQAASRLVEKDIDFDLVLAGDGEMRAEEVELKRICAFLRVSFSPSMYEYVNHTAYSMPNASLNYQWKNKMKRRELQLLESKIGDRLLQRGYEMSWYSPIKPSRLNEKMMLAQSKLAALRYRIRTFGLALITQETVSRYLGWSSLNKRATNKINLLIDANLR